MTSPMQAGFIFIPIHYIRYLHYAFIVVDIQAGSLTLYDSLRADASNQQRMHKVLQVASQWVQAMARNHTPQAPAVQWTLHVAQNMPCQNDAISCGLFMVMGLWHVCQQVLRHGHCNEVNFPFAQQHMDACSVLLHWHAWAQRAFRDT